MKNKLITVSKKGFVLFLVCTVLFAVGQIPALAQDTGRNIQPPTFSRCQDKVAAGRGDRAHYDNGTHGLPGKGDLEGRDDVYTLTDGNFLQCFCPSNGDTGIQSNWWNIGTLPLGRVDIDAYVRAGWVSVDNGKDWGLLDTPYLVKHQDFNCRTSSTTATVTPTATPRTNGPTATPNPESSCSNLAVDPKSGTAPLTVKFTGYGNDPGGDIGGYRFDFGDASNNQDQVVEQTGNEATHTYNNAGRYTASLQIKDHNGNWKNGNSDCKRTITVRAAPAVGGTSDTNELPQTGAPLSVFFGLMIVGEVGYILYKRFQLV